MERGLQKHYEGQPVGDGEHVWSLKKYFVENRNGRKMVYEWCKVPKPMFNIKLPENVDFWDGTHQHDDD